MLTDQRPKPRFEFPDPPVEVPAPVDQIPGQLGDQTFHPSEFSSDTVQLGVRTQSTGTDFELGHEFMEMPTKPVVQACSLPDQGLPVVGQQADVAGGPVEMSHWQVRFPQSHSSDRQRVDRVGLASFPAATSFPSHQLGVDPNQPFASRQQIGFKSPGEVPAVLHRKPPIGPLPRPPDQPRSIHRSSPPKSFLPTADPTRSRPPP